MLISVTSPKKGLGQSVTAINLTAMISNILNDTVLLVDTNKYYKDIAFHLSDSIFTKGLDDFKNLFDANMINSKLTFNSCVKSVSEKIDIMDSNECRKLRRKDIINLVNYINDYYGISVIDTIAGNNAITECFLEESQVVIVVLNQDYNSIYNMIKDKKYTTIDQEIIFIVNRYLDRINNNKVAYGIKEIRKDLSRAGFNKNNIFELSFDVDLLNECNDNTILNYIFNSKNEIKSYKKQLEEITSYTIGKYYNPKVEVKKSTKTSKSLSTLNILQGRRGINESVD